MATIEQPVESAAPPVTYRASWRMAALGLAVLYALEIAYAVFWMHALVVPRPWNLSDLTATAASGAIVSLPVLVAAIGVFAPGRSGVRVVTSASLAFLTGYAMIVGAWRLGRGGGVWLEAVGIVAAYFVFLLPAFAIKWSRRWDVVPAPKGRLDGRQYSVAGIMLATACVAIVFGVGRWVLPLARWPGRSDLWGVLSIQTMLFSGAIAWVGLPLLPLTALVLGVGRRLNSLIATLMTIAVVSLGMYLILRQLNGARELHAYAALMTGAYLSGVVWLLVIRACGFRLVRGRH